jgi:hypothetical protein
MTTPDPTPSPTPEEKDHGLDMGTGGVIPDRVSDGGVSVALAPSLTPPEGLTQPDPPEPQPDDAPITACGFCEQGIETRGGIQRQCPYCDGTGTAP